MEGNGALLHAIRGNLGAEGGIVGGIVLSGQVLDEIRQPLVRLGGHREGVVLAF
jgi:hypothetical protein